MPDNPSGLFAPTLRKQAATRFHHARPPLRWVGLLSPIAGLARHGIRVDRDELTLGRKDCDAIIADESVSRLHARIRRDGDDFVVTFKPDNIVAFRHAQASELRRMCRSLRWEIVSDRVAEPGDISSW